MNLHIIVMGVSGSGKSTVGEKLAEALNLPFLEGDSLHPKSNVDKMGERMAVAEQGLIVSCSSLKKSYRDCLRAAVGGQLAFVFLDGSFEVLHEHMGHRTGHFMPVTMLESQLATLESPVGEPLVFRVDVVDPIEKIVAESLEWLRSAKAELS
jgi:gluconokinase